MPVILIGCEARNNRRHGFALSGDAQVINCEASGNGGDGFHITEPAAPAPEPKKRPIARFLGNVSMNALGGAIAGFITGG